MSLQNTHSVAISVAVAALVGGASSLWAQPVPDAGALRQQIEQQRDLILVPGVRSAPVVPPPPEIQPQPGVSVTVIEFRFAGNTLLSNEQLTAALEGFANRTVGFAELQRAADTVAAAYRDAGWIVRVYLPQQDITEGIVTLQVVEARFAGIRFEGEMPKRVLTSEVEAYFRTRQGLGQPLNAEALDRALLLSDDLPGVSVAGTLVPGAAEGETALVLQATDEPLVYGDIGLDNTGSRATGSARLNANLNINSPGGRGERMALNLIHSEGSDYGRFALTVPDGHNGRRLGVSASSMTYRVINSTVGAGAVPITGRSTSMGVDWSYPLVRARLHNLYFSGGLERKHFVAQDFQLRSDYDTDSLRLGLSGNRFDNWGGGGANSAGVQMLWGRLSNILAHTQIDTIKRGYHKLSYSASRQQNLVDNHSLYFSLSGQHTTQVLDSSERFYIGGASSVRAYPSSEHGGDRGQQLSAEWRWRVHPTLVLTAFVDAGRVVQLSQPSIPRNVLCLRGQGLSLSWQGPKGLSTQLTWARRGGENPQPTLTGTDGDGTLRRDRVWFSASLPF